MPTSNTRSKRGLEEQGHHVLAILGLPGTGKTTVVRTLASLLPQATVIPEPQLPRAVHEQRGLAVAFDRPADNLAAALGFALTEFSLALGLKNSETELIIRDRGLEDQVYVVDELVERTLLAASSRRLLEDPRLLRADATILLTAEKSTRTFRMRSRPDDGWASAAIGSYERTFAAGYDTWVREKTNLLAEIDTTVATPAEVADEILQTVSETTALSTRHEAPSTTPGFVGRRIGRRGRWWS